MPTRLAAALLVFAAALPAPAPDLLHAALHAQTLARPGWSGSGMVLEPWYTHAVLYTVDPHRFTTTGLPGLARRIDYIHSLGVDAILLTRLQPASQPASSQPPAPLQAIDPALGTLDDLDTVLREAARTGLRVLVELAPTPADDAAALEAAARFFCARGAAGVGLGALPEARVQPLHQAVRALRGDKIVAAEHGRVELTLYPALTSPADPAPPAPAQPATAQPATAAVLRPALEAAQPPAQPPAQTPGTVLLFDHPFFDRLVAASPDAARPLALALLGTRANADLLSGQEIGQEIAPSPGPSPAPAPDPSPALPADSPARPSIPWGDDPAPARPSPSSVAAQDADPQSLLNWYRRLVDLHHGNAALRSGTVTFLNHDADDALVWVVRRAQVTPQAPALVAVCNLSGRPVTLSLTAGLAALHLRGNFLRPVLRSGPGMGGLSVDALTLPPFAAYIGELRF